MDPHIFQSLPYNSGTVPINPELLSRYLPPVLEGIASAWVKDNIPQGSWILDPFCASPRTVVEVARAGYKILVTANNPIGRFLLELAANPPKSEDLISSLSELAASYKGTDRIEPHIRSLYKTLCARCGQVVSADAFYWEQGNPSPMMRSYNCPFCGDSGEHPCTPYDVEQSSQFTTSGLHKARALERVVAAGDQDRIHVEQALSVYLPRALYALITLINKVEGLDISSTHKRCLSALLLHTFDQANVMWKIPASRERRRQLNVPRHFRENNIWLSLERAVNLWSNDDSTIVTQAVPISIWPESPPESGGICLYEGRFASLVDAVTGLEIKSVCTVIPRPNQAYWTLSALWTGWLWGRDAVRSFKSVLHRQRYDWGWHTSALASVFKQLANVLPSSSYVYGMLAEVEPGFITSSLVASAMSGLNLQGMAIRQEQDQVQILWKSNSETEGSVNRRSLVDLGIESAKKFLEIRGEPDRYTSAMIAASINIIKSDIEVNKGPGQLKVSSANQPQPDDASGRPDLSPSLVYSTVYNSAREALTYRSGFLQFNLQELANVESPQKMAGFFDISIPPDAAKRITDEEEPLDTSSSSEEAGSDSVKERPARSSDISESTLIWLRETKDANLVSISDRCELTIYNALCGNPFCLEQEIDRMICDLYRGLFTPELEFIRMCLESYGEQDQHDENRWHLRVEDYQADRQTEISQIIQYIHQIGKRLGLQSIDQSFAGAPNVAWITEDKELLMQFFAITSAGINQIIFSDVELKTKNFIVLPGSRANLVLFKLRRDPRLNKAFNPSTGNWQFLKFRHLRSLAANPLLNRDNLDQLLQLDPLTFSTPQLRLI